MFESMWQPCVPGAASPYLVLHGEPTTKETPTPQTECSSPCGNRVFILWVLGLDPKAVKQVLTQLSSQDKETTARRQVRVKGLLAFTLMISLFIYLLFIARGGHIKSTQISGGDRVRVAESKTRGAQSETPVSDGEFGNGTFPTIGYDEKNLSAEARGPITSIFSGKLPPSEVLPSTSSPYPKMKNNATDSLSDSTQDRNNNLRTSDMLRAEVEAKKAVIAVLSQPVVNVHDFEYLRNPVGACATSYTEVLIVVPSAPRHAEQRMKIRKGSLGDYVRAPSNNANMVFFVGEPECNGDAAKVQRDIDDEFQTYGDVVQEQYLDVYRNIRLKAVSMLRWAATYCKHAEYVIRTDDDVVVNITKIVAAVKKKGSEFQDFILGVRKDGWSPVRKNHTQGLKYAVSEEEYPDATYPPFAVGGLLGYPLSTVVLLYQAALRVKPLWLDDVYITGICAQRLQLPLITDPDFVFQH